MKSEAAPAPVPPTDQDLDALRADLARPEAFGDAGGEVSQLETHISLLVFAGTRVYKIKKAVDLGFLDFTTLERRRHFCDEEVRLNRRLAESTYLGVVPITRSAGGLVVGGDGAPVEWAVEMRRLPAERMLSERLERGEIDNQPLNEIVERLVAFHASARTGPGVDEHGSPGSVRWNIDENYRQLLPFVGQDADGEAHRGWVHSRRLHEFLVWRDERFLRERGALLEERRKAGRIREGHGDLHAANICFTPEGLQMYDCIEFNERFRCGDVAGEVAFLAMDLDARGYAGFAGYLVHHYAELAGDPGLLEVVGDFKRYRAIVRAKVAALTSLDEGLVPAERERVRREAMRYVQLAASYELPPALILMCGLPGTGKSYLARRFARIFRAVLLQSDVRRKRLAGIPTRQDASEAFGEGLYAPGLRARTYRSLLEDEARDLIAGRTVILDVACARNADRQRFIDAAARLGRPYYLVHVDAPESVVRERLRQRSEEGTDASDADFDVYLRARECFEPLDGISPSHVLNVQSGVSPTEEVSAALIDRRIALEFDPKYAPWSR